MKMAAACFHSKCLLPNEVPHLTAFPSPAVLHDEKQGPSQLHADSRARARREGDETAYQPLFPHSRHAAVGIPKDIVATYERKCLRCLQVLASREHMRALPAHPRRVRDPRTGTRCACRARMWLHTASTVPWFSTVIPVRLADFTLAASRGARGEAARRAGRMLTQRTGGSAPCSTQADSEERRPQKTEQTRSVGRCWGIGARPAGDARSVRDSTAWTGVAAQVRSRRPRLSLPPRGHPTSPPPLARHARPALSKHAGPAALCRGESPR